MFLRRDKQQERIEADGQRSPADVSDVELVVGLRSLEDAAWAELYQRHAQQVYAYIYFRLGDQHIAEDLAADVFVRALAGIKGYSYRGTPVLAWLYRIAHNVTIDYRKSAARRSRHQVAEAPAEIKSSIDELRDIDDRSDMMRAVHTLTPDQQQVIILRFYQGLSNAEVSAVLEKPEGAVKALQTRALRSLRRTMTEREPMRQSA